MKNQTNVSMVNDNNYYLNGKITIKEKKNKTNNVN